MEAKKTVLYQKHFELTAGKAMADFAGYLMPLWYSSIKDEHAAVRNSAGIFDCTHMGLLEFTGENVLQFINLITANDINKISAGQAQYSFIYTNEGKIVDDLIVYRISDEKIIMVVNAANDASVQAYLNNLPAEITQRCSPLPKIRDLRDPQVGSDQKAVVPVQGPKSKEIISSLICPADKEKFESLGSFCFLETTIDDFNLIICTTGYTGSKIGYEFLVHPDNAMELWDLVIAKGASPCGLGARDSLRIEAGLPLFGHELDGEFKISPFQAGYGWAVALDKSYFSGHETVRQLSKDFKMKIARIEIDGSKGKRPVRQGDAILNSSEICIGEILSSVKIDDKQVVLAFIEKEQASVGAEISAYYVARNQRHISQGIKSSAIVGDKYENQLAGTITKRFVKF